MGAVGLENREGTGDNTSFAHSCHVLGNLIARCLEMRTEVFPAALKNNPDKFSAYAIPPYTPGKLSALVKAHQSRLADIERLRRLAAAKALATDNCIRVESVELHSKSSQPA